MKASTCQPIQSKQEQNSCPYSMPGEKARGRSTYPFYSFLRSGIFPGGRDHTPAYQRWVCHPASPFPFLKALYSTRMLSTLPPHAESKKCLLPGDQMTRPKDDRQMTR